MKPSCFFSNAVRADARALVAGLLLALLAGAGPVLAEETSPAPATPAADSSGLAAPVGTPAPVAAATSPSANLPALQVHEAGAASPDHQIRVGDRVTLQVELGTLGADPSKLSIKPEDAATKPEDSGWFIDPSTLSQGGILRFVVSPLKGGSLTLPALMISGSEDRVLAKTVPFAMTVTAPATSDTGKPDLLDVLSVQLPLRYWILLMLALLGLAVAVFFAWRSWMKRKRTLKPEKLPLVPREPDHLVALRKLDILFDAHPFTPENLKIVSFGTSEILKEFFSRRFRIDALESTTDEMMALLKRESLQPEHLREVRNLFDELDLYKFTNVESYPRVYPEIHEGLKLKAQIIIQKWALVIVETRASGKTGPEASS